MVKDFDEVPADFQFIKAEYTGPKNKLDRLEQNIPEWLKDYNVARSDPMILEINKHEASKGRGVHQLAQKLGIKDDEVMILVTRAMIYPCLRILI